MTNQHHVAVALPGSWTYTPYVAPHDRVPRRIGAVTLILARPESIPDSSTIRQVLEIEGDSHLAICRPAIDVDSPNRALHFQTFDATGQSVAFRGDANSAGYLGKVHITGLPFNEVRACEDAALTIIQPNLALLSYNNDIPIFVWQVHIAPIGTNKTFVRMPERFFHRRNGNRQQIFPPAFALIVPSYREALNLVQISPLLSFVLFYRVIEATTALRQRPAPDNPRIRQRVPNSWPEICVWLSALLNFTTINVAGAHEIVPKEAVGKKYSWLIDERLRKLRNRIAHGLINDGTVTETNTSGDDENFSSVDDPELQVAVQQWLPLCHVLARAALNDVGGLEQVEFGEPPHLAIQERVGREQAMINLKATAKRASD